MNYPLNLELSKGLPLIVVRISDYSVCLMLDTGADTNIFRPKTYEEYKKKLSLTEEQQPQYKDITSPYGTAKALLVDLPFHFEGQNYIEPFSITNTCDPALENFSNSIGIPISGILSSEFFYKHGWIIDFKRKEIYNEHPIVNNQ